MATFGRYELRGTLGEGGFATVYRAWDPLHQREVALKTLLPHLSANPAVRRRFVAEANALLSFGHRNIVTVHDVGDADGQSFFAMELIEGRTLEQIAINGGQLPLATVAGIAVPLASAIDYLHAAGLVHRDIKAANVMLDTHGRVVLMDFGIARSVDATRYTGTGALLGTPEYVAPEQMRGEEVGPPADIYALGVLIYQLLAGRLPFVGELWYVLHAHGFDPPPPLRGFRPDLPPEIYATVESALAKSHDERPPSAKALAAPFTPYLPAGHTPNEALARPSQTMIVPAGPSRSSRSPDTGRPTAPAARPTPPPAADHTPAARPTPPPEATQAIPRQELRPRPMPEPQPPPRPPSAPQEAQPAASAPANPPTHTGSGRPATQPAPVVPTPADQPLAARALSAALPPTVTVPRTRQEPPAEPPPAHHAPTPPGGSAPAARPPQQATPTLAAPLVWPAPGEAQPATQPAPPARPTPPDDVFAPPPRRVIPSIRDGGPRPPVEDATTERTRALPPPAGGRRTVMLASVAAVVLLLGGGGAAFALIGRDGKTDVGAATSVPAGVTVAATAGAAPSAPATLTATATATVTPMPSPTPAPVSLAGFKVADSATGADGEVVQGNGINLCFETSAANVALVAAISRGAAAPASPGDASVVTRADLPAGPAAACHTLALPGDLAPGEYGAWVFQGAHRAGGAAFRLSATPTPEPTVAPTIVNTPVRTATAPPTAAPPIRTAAPVQPTVAPPVRTTAPVQPTAPVVVQTPAPTQPPQPTQPPVRTPPGSGGGDTLPVRTPPGGG